jgi:hypothetical protein
MIAENDDIGAILLECTELSPHAVAVQNAALIEGAAEMALNLYRLNRSEP